MSLNTTKVKTVAEVVMPLVQLLKRDDLSWSDREDITEAIQSCQTHHTRMAEERQKPNPYGQQQGLGGVASQTPQNARNPYIS